MYLKAKDYIKEDVVSSEISSQKKTEIKNKIEALVPSKEKMLYKEVINAIEQEYIENGEHLNTDEILKIVKEVDKEWYPAEKIK